MNIPVFFEKNDQLSYHILEHFSGQSEPVSQTTILKKLQISEYKFNQLIDALNSDLQTIKTNELSYFRVFDKIIVKGINISTNVIHQMKLLYLKRSTLLPIFTYHFLESNQTSRESFRKKHFISKTRYYAAKRELQKLLSTTGFFSSPNLITDSEYIIRLRLFEFYYLAFNGLSSPFNDMDTNINNLIILLERYFHFDTNPLNHTKLEMFLKIWLLRVKNHNDLTIDIIPTNNSTQTMQSRLKGVQQFIKEHFNLILSEHELNYLYTFLISQHYLPEQLTYLNHQDFESSYELTDHFMSVILSKQSLLNTSKLNVHALRTSLNEFHLRLSTLYVEATTFMEDQQRYYFKQHYQIFDIIITEHLKYLESQRALVLDQTDYTNLYFEYMFILIHRIPQSILNDKVTICVEFSQGALCTQFITEKIKQFFNDELIIETSLSPQTDLYLSDFHINSIKQPQLTWQTLPTDSEWEKLRRTVTDIKEEKIATPAKSVATTLSNYKSC